MKISLIGPVYPFRGGIAHHTSLLAQAIILAMHDLRVVSFHKQYPSWLYPGRTDKDPSESKIQTKADFILSPFNPWSWLKALKQIKKDQPDVVVVQWWTTFWAIQLSYLVSSLRRAGIGVIYLVHNVFPHECKPWDPRLSKFALSKTDNFIVHSNSQKLVLRSLFPDAEIKLAPHPNYSHFLRDKIPQGEAQTKLGLDHDRPVLLTFGIVRPYKGLEDLLNAIQHLSQSDIEVQLVVAGEFWEDKNRFLSLANCLGIDQMVRFDDRYIPNEEVGLYFFASDLFIAPYRSATQSGSLRIAMAACLDLIITEPLANSVPEDYSGRTRVVPAQKPIEIAKAIEELLLSAPSVRTDTPSDHSITPGWEKLVDLIECFKVKN
jgi:glycosyltransferase involved in cell wall biosynthesis